MSRGARSRPDAGGERVDAHAALGRFSTGAIGGAMGVAIHRSILRQYVHDYLHEHGRFPVGRHRVRGRYADAVISFEAEFPASRERDGTLARPLVRLIQ